MCTKTCYKFDRYLILGTLVYALLYNLRRTCQDLISDVRGTWSYWWNWWYFYLAFSMWNFAEACVPRPRYRCERFRGKLSRADAATSSSRRRCWEGDKGERVTGEGEKVAGGGERATWAALSLVEVRICIHRDKQSGDVKCCQQESFFFIEGSIWYFSERGGSGWKSGETAKAWCCWRWWMGGRAPWCGKRRPAREEEGLRRRRCATNARRRRGPRGGRAGWPHPLGAACWPRWNHH